MTRADLQKAAHLHATTAIALRHLLVQIGETETPDKIREEVQTEIVDYLHRRAEYCEALAMQFNDQADLQSYDSDIEADAQRERMA